MQIFMNNFIFYAFFCCLYLQKGEVGQLELHFGIPQWKILERE